MMKIRSRFLLTPALLAVFGCNQPDSSAPNATAPAATEKGQANADKLAADIVRLKALHLPDEQKQYGEILTKNGIPLESPTAGAAPQGDASKAAKAASLAKSSATAGLTEVWTELFSTEARAVQKVVYRKFYLSQGMKYLWTTTTANAGVDPVMVVFRVNTDAFRNSGDLQFGAVTNTITVSDYSDDYNGLMPRIAFQARDAGWYGLLVFSYGPYNHGNVELRTGIACDPQPATGYCISGPENVETINVRGSMVNFDSYYSGSFDAGKLLSSDGADPVLWMFGMHKEATPPSWDGLINDDDPRGGTVNSYAFSTALPYPPFQAGQLRFGVVSGYSDGGTAVFHGGSITLSGCIPGPGRTCP
jgi:hypothetical protein